MLHINALKAGYADHTVIDLPLLKIEQGQKWLIRGPSGSGKTTLLQSIAGFGPVQSGSIVVDGTDLYRLSERERDGFRGGHMGLVFQTLHLIKSLTVFENVVLGPFSSHVPQNIAWARDLLERLGIAELADRPATQISQGQAQRVAIARALVTKPIILLADEPTSSLDNQSAQTVMGLLQSLAAETNTTLVVTSHDDRIMGAFDHTYILGSV